MAPAVLVARIHAGGTGLNIQAASVVVLMEPQIKPSLEEQAIARAHRMGQTRRVLVYRLLDEDSATSALYRSRPARNATSTLTPAATGTL